MKLAEITQKLGCRIEGNAELEITGVAGLENAQPGQLTFLSNPKYRALVETTRASAILLGEGAALRRPPGAPPLAVLRSENTDRKSTRLNSSHSQISYAVFCLKKKKPQPRSKLHTRQI